MIPKLLAVQMTPYIVTGGMLRPRSLLAKGIIQYRLRTEGEGALPAFIIIGGQRCGTTSLYDLLLGHPEVYPAVAKEIHFFDKHFHHGEEWYRANFPSFPSDVSHRRSSLLTTGEATPSYLFHPHAPERIYNLLPEVKLIVLLRNPVERAYSHYNLSKQQGVENLTFERALAVEEERIRDDYARLQYDHTYSAPDWSRFSYVSRGVYADQLPGWMELFPTERLLILQSEAFYRDPAQTLRRLTEFLNLSHGGEDSKQHRRTLSPTRVITRQSSMSRRTRTELNAFFQPHNERLFRLIGEEYDWNG